MIGINIEDAFNDFVVDLEVAITGAIEDQLLAFDHRIHHFVHEIDAIVEDMSAFL